MCEVPDAWFKIPNSIMNFVYLENILQMSSVYTKI